MISIIFLIYDKYERNIMSFQIATHFLGCYLLFGEASFRFRDEIKHLSNTIKKTVIFGILILCYFFGLLTGIQFINLFGDTFLTGHQTKELVIFGSEKVYNGSDRIFVIMDGERKALYLAAGYVEVKSNLKYLVHVFEKSKIVIPIEGPLK